MLRPIKTKQFEKDQKRSRKQQQRNFKVLEEVVLQLIAQKTLDPKFKDHSLKGHWKGCRDCHIQNDWVLIYRINEKEGTIIFERIGSHSELFK
jgi:mRNA interferase YafQ